MSINPPDDRARRQAIAAARLLGVVAIGRGNRRYMDRDTFAAEITRSAFADAKLRHRKGYR